MGTTLTGTTPANTYDSLIKVTDNGPLSGTAKYLSDGLGNDSKLALSTGNIGINTATPDIFGRFYTYSLGLDSSGTTAFQINGTSYSTIDMGTNGVRLGFFTQSGTETSLGNLSTLPLVFQTNSVERMRITSTGNVGIGTSSPDTALDVNGGSKFRGSISGFTGGEILLNGGNNSQVALSTNGTGSTEMYLDHRGSSTGIWKFRDTTDVRMAIIGGNVGIGTSNPADKLEIAGNIRANVSNGSGFMLTGASASGLVRNGGTGLSLRTNTTDRLTIDINGNVGIGTASPQQKLHIAGVGANSYALLGTSTNWGAADTNRIKIGSTGDTFTLGCDLRANTNYAGTTETSLGLWVTNGSSTMVEVVRATQNGLTFNGDTAAANALDDYEEGTFTPTFSGTTYGGATANIGRYTKIGRMVQFEIFIYNASFSGSSGNAIIGGLPFTSNSNVYGQGLISYNNCVDGNTNGGYVDVNSTNFYPIDENATTVASFIDGSANRKLMVSGTYTV